jgi:hypothetical protein
VLLLSSFPSSVWEEQFQNTIEESCLLTRSDLDKLEQLSKGLCWDQTIIVESKVDCFRQHTAGLHWIRTQQFQQDTLDTDAFIVHKLCQIA